MAEAATAEKQQPIPIDERVLTEVDHLSQHRLEDGSYAPRVLDDVLVNLRTAVQEAAMPYAVSTTEHEYRADPETKKGTFMWLGKTAVEAAMSGYSFHYDEAAKKRVDIEVDEARHTETDLRPDTLKVFISPRMSESDASLEVAKQEHLAHEDSVRVSRAVIDEHGQTEKRVLQSLLVRDVPLEAWVAMLQDPDSIFGKSIDIANPQSALSVMEVHRQLELPLDALPHGPTSLVEAVLPYISDPHASQKITRQIELFKGDQEDMQRKAENIAERWLTFEVALSESLDTGFANFEAKRFIVGLQEHWGADDLRVIQDHQLPEVEFRMSRQLAAVLEKAKQNTLWAPAAVITNNPEVLKQLDAAVAQKIYDNEMLLQMAWTNGQVTAPLESQSNILIATKNIRVGGGCAGTNKPSFEDSKDGIGTDEGQAKNNPEDKDNWKWKHGICQVKTCPTRPGKTEVGPCSVCRKCQTKFDKGEDPTNDSNVAAVEQPKLEKFQLFQLKPKETTQPEDKPAPQQERQLVEVY